MLYISGCSSRRSDNTHRGAVKQEDGEIIHNCVWSKPWLWSVGSFVLDIEEQTRGVIENIRRCLLAVGADLHHLVDFTCYLIGKSVARLIVFLISFRYDILFQV